MFILNTLKVYVYTKIIGILCVKNVKNDQKLVKCASSRKSINLFKSPREYMYINII